LWNIEIDKSELKFQSHPGAVRLDKRTDFTDANFVNREENL